MRSAAFAWRVMLMIALAQAHVARGEGESLHSLIDQQLAPVGGLVVAKASDAEFLRRVSLDLVGMPPTADEARAFLKDSAADKREKLIDRLFASPHFARNLAATLDLMLMERRPNTHVPADDWQAWLVNSVRQNKPWNVLARELLQADGADPAQRPAARFVLDRASDPNVVTRDVGRIFFGRDMQCAQCHDHPLVAEYLQSDYHGLLAFVSPSHPVIRTEGDKQTTVQAERAGADLKFESVFVGKPRRTGARVPDGVQLDEPYYLPGEEYEVAPGENVKSIPKFSRREKLAELATSGTNHAFNRNIANRLWAHMLGRGLVHPLDLNHPENPATYPELLRGLGERLAAMEFDIRAYLREIALSDAYQRGYDMPGDLISLSARAAEEAKRLDDERAKLQEKSKLTEEAYTVAMEAWEKAEAELLPVATELETARTQYASAKQKADEAVKAATDAETQLAAKQKVVEPVQQAANAAKQAAETLKDDKELVAAAQTFATRAQQLAAEVDTLTKTAAEKKTAVEPSTKAWNDTKPVIEGARTKVTPLTAKVRESEQAMLAARTKAADAAEDLAALERRLETARGVAQLDDMQQAIAAANTLVTARESELAVAEKQLTEALPPVADAETKAKPLADALTAADTALKTVQDEHARRADVAQALAAAVASTDAARQKLPDDAALIEALKQLTERADRGKADADESQRQVDAAQAACQSAGDALAAAQQSLEAAVAARTMREQAVASAKESLVAARADVGAKQADLDKAIAELTERWTNDFTIAALKPLTPEQLCWTVFRVSGVYDRYWKAEVAELDKTKPLSDDELKDPDKLAAREVELEQRTFDKLKGNIATFVAHYGAAAGQPQGDFFSTADQALFAENGGAINSWVAPVGGNVTERIMSQADPRAAAEELYLAVLTRLPTEDETAEVVTHLTEGAKDKSAAAQQLVWGLMNSAEFRFNH